MREFDAKLMLKDKYFFDLTKAIVFDELPRKEILNLIRKFDIEYSKYMDVPTSDIHYSYKYSYIIDHAYIYLNVELLSLKKFGEELLKDYLHEKRHMIQYLSYKNHDNTILKDKFDYIVAHYMTTPVSNSTYYKLMDVKSNYQLIPHEEDAYYNSNLELYKLVKQMLIVSDKQGIKIDKGRAKRILSNCDSTVEYYKCDEINYIRDMYYKAIAKFYELYKKEEILKK